MREAVKRRKRHKAGPLFGDRRVGEQWCNIFARCEGAAAFLYDTTTDTLLFEDGRGRMRRIRRFLEEGYRSFPAVPRDRELFARTVRSMKERKISQRQCRLRIPERGGSLCWYDCRIAVLTQKKRTLVGGLLTDITEQYRITGRLRRQARMDVLTGLYNKAGEVVIEGLLAARSTGIFLMVDLDNFRTINSIYGHPQGDRLLWEAGQALRRACTEQAVAMRAGGDEFVVFWPEGTRAEASQYAQEILDRMAEVQPLEKGLVLSGSIGIAIAPDDGKTYGELYAAADRAMYEVKKNSKQGYAFFSDPS